ncbi:hypothetical protein F511_20479 [Dorcoceras hygrometricum]|uniref:Uncharacterized protein n=1 Tax=Dorcoceras hygrometricum TaxID=472368 RepID=A0A2Z7CPU0_9LAMI|nr:hypothetical protein F511_20479 [Dorcoceras hygrometricum]
MGMNRMFIRWTRARLAGPSPSLSLLMPPPPPLPRFAGNCSGQLDEENPSAPISSGLLVQADEGVSLRSSYPESQIQKLKPAEELSNSTVRRNQQLRDPLQGRSTASTGSSSQRNQQQPSDVVFSKEHQNDAASTNQNDNASFQQLTTDSLQNNQQLVALINSNNDVLHPLQELAVNSKRKVLNQNAALQLIKTTSPLISDWFLKPAAGHSAGTIPHNATADSATIRRYSLQNNQQLVALINSNNDVLHPLQELAVNSKRKVLNQNAALQLIKTTSPLISDWFLKPAAGHSAGTIPHNATADSATIQQSTPKD